jgi:predicted HTH domain antitoxin
MGDILSVRLDDQLNKLINNFIKDQHMEKSEAIRQLILKGVYMNAVQGYLEQKISIQKAASMANMALSDFMDFLGKLGIGSQLDLEDILTGYDNLRLIAEKR